MLISYQQLNSELNSEFNSEIGFSFQQEIQIASTFFFSIWCSEDKWEMLTTNYFLLSTIFFSRILIFLISTCVLVFFQSLPKKSIKSGAMQSVLQLALFSFFVLLLRPLQCFSTYFRKSKKNGVLQPIFPDCAISCEFGAMFLSVRSYFFCK